MRPLGMWFLMRVGFFDFARPGFFRRRFVTVFQVKLAGGFRAVERGRVRFGSGDHLNLDSVLARQFWRFLFVPLLYRCSVIVRHARVEATLTLLGFLGSR